MSYPLQALRLLLTDITTLTTLSVASATAAYAAYRANDSLLKPRDDSSRQPPTLSEQIIDENTRILEGSMALALPVFATVSIIFLFFFLGSIGMLLTALSTFSGSFSVLFVLWPLGEIMIRKLRSAGLPVRSGGIAEASLLLPIVFLIIGWWLFTGHWLPNNIIGISLCIIFAALCRVPSLKVTSMLFAGLFVYDVFFVFFSERFFGRNVMVEVATSTPTNPAHVIANAFHLPFTPVKNLALPAKLIFPAPGGHEAILGLGDIILPEVLLVYLLEFDIKNLVKPIYTGYFCRALVAYVFGLLTSFYFNFAFHVAQPALLYIVPSMLIPTAIFAQRRGELRQLWNGLIRNADNSISEYSHRNGDEGSSGKDQERSALLP